jgi:putative transposase
MTPAVVHHGHEGEIRANRQHVLDEAYAAHPERFVNGRRVTLKAPNNIAKGNLFLPLKAAQKAKSYKLLVNHYYHITAQSIRR